MRLILCNEPNSRIVSVKISSHFILAASEATRAETPTRPSDRPNLETHRFAGGRHDCKADISKQASSIAS